MKFCQTWKKEVTTLPDLLADSCINYKRYKKLIQRADYKEIMTAIISDCKRVNRDFIKYVHPTRRIIFSRPFKFEIVPIKTDLLKFAQLNNICIRKICKKADKVVGDLPYPQFFTKWLSKCKTEHHWNFMDGKELTLLEMKTRSNETNGEVLKMECPICFEDKKETMIMKCGHHMCLSCTLDMLNASKLHGTLYNIVAYSRFENPNRACCPFCRYKHALVDFEILGPNVAKCKY